MHVMHKIKTVSHAGKVKTHSHNMEKVKIKRVKRNVKVPTTQEKILGAVGLASTLLGGASSVTSKPQNTQIVRTQTEQSSKSSSIRQALKNVFGVSEAKAFDDTLPSEDVVINTDSTTSDNASASLDAGLTQSVSGTDTSLKEELPARDPIPTEDSFVASTESVNSQETLTQGNTSEIVDTKTKTDTVTNSETEQVGYTLNAYDPVVPEGNTEQSTSQNLGLDVWTNQSTGEQSAYVSNYGIVTFNPKTGEYKDQAGNLVKDSSVEVSFTVPNSVQVIPGTEPNSQSNVNLNNGGQVFSTENINVNQFSGSSSGASLSSGLADTGSGTSSSVTGELPSSFSLTDDIARAAGLRTDSPVTAEGGVPVEVVVIGNTLYRWQGGQFVKVAQGAEAAAQVNSFSNIGWYQSGGGLPGAAKIAIGTGLGAASGAAIGSMFSVAGTAVSSGITFAGASAASGFGTSVAAGSAGGPIGLAIGAAVGGVIAGINAIINKGQDKVRDTKKIEEAYPYFNQIIQQYYSVTPNSPEEAQALHDAATSAIQQLFNQIPFEKGSSKTDQEQWLQTNYFSNLDKNLNDWQSSFQSDYSNLEVFSQPSGAKSAYVGQWGEIRVSPTGQVLSWQGSSDTPPPASVVQAILNATPKNIQAATSGDTSTENYDVYVTDAGGKTAYVSGFGTITVLDDGSVVDNTGKKVEGVPASVVAGINNSQNITDIRSSQSNSGLGAQNLNLSGIEVYENTNTSGQVQRQAYVDGFGIVTVIGNKAYDNSGTEITDSAVANQLVSSFQNSNPISSSSGSVVRVSESGASTESTSSSNASVSRGSSNLSNIDLVTAAGKTGFTSSNQDAQRLITLSAQGILPNSIAPGSYYSQLFKLQLPTAPVNGQTVVLNNNADFTYKYDAASGAFVRTSPQAAVLPTSPYMQGVTVNNSNDGSSQAENSTQFATKETADYYAKLLGGTVEAITYNAGPFSLSAPQYQIRVGNTLLNAGLVADTFQKNGEQLATIQIKSQIAQGNGQAVPTWNEIANTLNSGGSVYGVKDSPAQLAGITTTLTQAQQEKLISEASTKNVSQLTQEERTFLQNYYGSHPERLPQTFMPGSYVAWGLGLGDSTSPSATTQTAASTYGFEYKNGQYVKSATSVTTNSNWIQADEAYWAKQPAAVQKLRTVEDLEARKALGEQLAKQGYTIDVPIMVWQWSPTKTTQLRQDYGYTWVPSALQENVQIAPGLTVPGSNLKPYDPNNAPAGSIKVVSTGATYTAPTVSNTFVNGSGSAVGNGSVSGQVAPAVTVTQVLAGSQSNQLSPYTAQVSVGDYVELRGQNFDQVQNVKFVVNNVETLVGSVNTANSIQFKIPSISASNGSSISVKLGLKDGTSKAISTVLKFSVATTQSKLSQSQSSSVENVGGNTKVQINFDSDSTLKGVKTAAVNSTVNTSSQDNSIMMYKDGKVAPLKDVSAISESVDTSKGNVQSVENGISERLLQHVADLKERISVLEDKAVKSPEVAPIINEQVSGLKQQVTDLEKTVKSVANSGMNTQSISMPDESVSDNGALKNENQNTYTVKKGDTLWSIAKRFYGEGRKWRKILSANTKVVKDPNSLKMGTEIVIPNL